MPMTEEAKAAQSEKMKAAWAKRKAAKQAAEVPADPAIREAMAKAPMNAVVERIPAQLVVTHDQGDSDVFVNQGIVVIVNWEKTPMPEAQRYYAQLKEEFEKAGRILNARSMERVSGFTCFMCHKHFDGNPGFTDHSYIDPATGLSPRVDCCGELCVINYNSFRINQRHQKDLARAAEERA